MKYLSILLALAVTLCTAAPSIASPRDFFRRHFDRGHSSHSHYCPPTTTYRSYQPYRYYSASPSYHSSYPYYSSNPYYSPYGYPYGYSPYGYSRPSVALSFSTAPSYSYSRTNRVNDDDDDLAVDVQRALSRRGYYRGEIDGDIGPATRAAIRRYQYDRRLEVTGRIDRTLLRSLDVG